MSEPGGCSHSRSRVGIFRRVAVERYTQPLEPDIPEMLTPRVSGIMILAGLALLCAAVALLWIA